MLDEDRAALAARASRAARSNVLLTPAIAAAGLAASVVVVRILPQADFALYALALAVRGSVQSLADMGTGAASSRLFAELQQRGGRSQARRVFGRLAAVRTVVIVALAIAVATMPDTFARLLSLRSHEHYFLAFLVLIGAAEVGAGLGFYTLTGTFGHQILNRALLLQGILQPLLVVAAAATGLGLAGILAGLFVGSALKAAILAVASLRTLSKIPEDRERVEGVAGSYTRVAVGSVVGKAASWVHSRQFVTPVVISAVSRERVAVYSISYDWVHQVLNLVAAPLYTLLLPTFSSGYRDQEFSRRFFQLATRTLALVAFPTAAVLVAAFPAISATLFGSGYSDAPYFAAIVAPCFALEVVLSGPATALMLANERLTTAYGAIKLVVLALGSIYVVTAGASLLVVAGIMMGIRATAAFALHLIIYRKLRIHVDVLWFALALGAAATSGLLGALTALIVPGQATDLVLVPLVSLTAFAVLVRYARLLSRADAGAVTQVLPFAKRALAPLVRP